MIKIDLNSQQIQIIRRGTTYIYVNYDFNNAEIMKDIYTGCTNFHADIHKNI